MTAWRQGLVAAVAACVLMHAGLAHATKDCGLKGCPATQQNDPQGQQQQPQTLERIYVHAQRTQQAFPLPWVNYSGLPPVNFGLGNAHGPGEFRSNNYVTVTDQSRNRDNQDCKGTAGDPIELSTTAKIESLVLFQLPGEMGLRFELDYTSTGGWHDNLDYELDPFCGSNDQCYFTTLRRPDGSTVTFHGSYAGTSKERQKSAAAVLPRWTTTQTVPT